MEEERYVLTEAACMKEALADFGVNVSMPMAKGIEDRFMELMVAAGHAVWSEK